MQIWKEVAEDFGEIHLLQLKIKKTVYKKDSDRKSEILSCQL